MTIGICTTDGSGRWSNKTADVPVLQLTIDYLDNDLTFGELRAKFDKNAWNINADGLIYTDRRWMREFRDLLISKGFSSDAVNPKNLDYSEQGMQGCDYVSMDIGELFIKEALSQHLDLIQNLS